MYEQKNKLTQPAPVLDEISIRLSDAVHRNITHSLWVFYLQLQYSPH